MNCARCGEVTDTAFVNRNNMTPIPLCPKHSEEHAAAVKGFSEVIFTDDINEVEAV